MPALSYSITISDEESAYCQQRPAGDSGQETKRSVRQTSGIGQCQSNRPAILRRPPLPRTWNEQDQTV